MNFLFTGRWCRRDWSSPPDARAQEASRRVLYSQVFLGSPGECKQKLFSIYLIDYFRAAPLYEEAKQ